MRFAYLGSGSRGNAALISSGSTVVMLDCGFSLAETERRLERLGTAPEALAAIIVTHEHADHMSGVALFARRYSIPVWLTDGTYAAWDDHDVPMVRQFSAYESFAIGDLQVRPYPVPHDAREPCQYVLSDGAQRVGVLTDVGHITPHIRGQLTGCDALLVECNHDSGQLLNGPYPDALKRRVAGPLGHLSNAQAAQLLCDIDLTRLQHLVLVHLSETNNTPALACAAVSQALGIGNDEIEVANQDDGLGWREVAA